MNVLPNQIQVRFKILTSNLDSKDVMHFKIKENGGKKIMFYYFYRYKPAQIIITDAMNYIPVCVNFIIFYNSHI